MTETRVPAGVPTGGQFAASAHAESEVTLDAPATQNHALALLADVDLPGSLTEYGEHGVLYTDPDGHEYSIGTTAEGVSLSVSARDVDAWTSSVSFDKVTPKDVVRALDEVQEKATEVRAFARVSAAYAAAGSEAVTHDDYDGTLTIDNGTDGPVVLCGFTGNDERFFGRRSSLLARISDTDGDREFEYAIVGGADNFVQVYRDENTSRPLPAWEAEAVLGEIDRRAGGTGLDAPMLLLEARSRALQAGAQA